MRMRQKPRNPDEDGGVPAHASKARATGRVIQDAEEPQQDQARKTTVGEAMRMNHAPGGVVAVAIAMRPMKTNHAENAAMSQRGWKRWNYLWTPILRITRTPRVAVGVVVVVDEGDNHLDVIAGWFSITRS